MPFSILVPSWNNLRYLRLCVDSLRRHSAHAHQLIVHVNEGADGTHEWVEREGIEHTSSDTNVGICVAMNTAAQRARGDHLLYVNDDMVAAPGWDVALERALDRVRAHPSYMLSGTMIEPVAHGNTCAVVADYGRDPDAFDVGRFAREAPGKARQDWLGATWPPTLVSRAAWEDVGGYSVEFSPGMGSDNDFAMKLWQAGCRVFLGVGDCLFYHFSGVSTGRVRGNNGRRLFLRKWGVTQAAFDRHCLRRGQPVPPGEHGFVVADPEASAGWVAARIAGAIRRRIG